MYISESKLKNIVNKSVNKLLKESFNDNNISIEIENHGGLDKSYRGIGASKYANYDLQNCQYEGYLSNETINELSDANLLYLLGEHLLYTNDGGAIVVGERYDKKESYYQSPWQKKVQDRNSKWGKETNSLHGEESTIAPNSFNTINRRSERKKY